MAGVYIESRHESVNVVNTKTRMKSQQILKLVLACSMSDVMRHFILNMDFQLHNFVSHHLTSATTRRKLDKTEKTRLFFLINLKSVQQLPATCSGVAFFFCLHSFFHFSFLSSKCQCIVCLTKIIIIIALFIMIMRWPNTKPIAKCTA